MKRTFDENPLTTLERAMALVSPALRISSMVPSKEKVEEVAIKLMVEDAQASEEFLDAERDKKASRKQT